VLGVLAGVVASGTGPARAVFGVAVGAGSGGVEERRRRWGRRQRATAGASWLERTK
jgi:hypothetical protein